MVREPSVSDVFGRDRLGAPVVDARATRKALGAMGSGMKYSVFLVNLGEAYLLAGQPEDARAAAEQAPYGHTPAR